MTRPRLSAFSVLGVCALFALAGCFGPPAAAPTSSSASPSATASPTPTTTATPTATAPPSSAPPSSATQSPPATQEPTSTGLPEQVAPLTVYYVAIGDNGTSGPMIGCGDSLVATTTAPVRFTDQVGPSIGALLANKSRDVGLSGLVNVLYQSNLTYIGGELNGSTITINLAGQFMLGGVCDIPRAKAQL
jgi:cytoskeletal protein RodZ